MKRILMLNYEFPPLGGGAATATFNLLKEHAKRDDVEVDLITSSADNYKEEQFAENIKIYYLDIGKKGKLHDQSNRDLMVYSWKAWKFAGKLKKSKKYDITHAFFGIPCGFIAMLLKIPYIVSLRGSDVPFYSKKYRWLDLLFFRWLDRIIWNRAKAVVANSEGLRELALKTSPNQKIGVIYNGVDTEKFEPAQIKPEHFTVISTSRLIERKGIRYLIEGFARHCEKYLQSRLKIVGGGPQKEELEDLTRRLGVLEKVVFMGETDRENMPKIYQTADVFVLPSLNEGMSNCLLEAMASGLAVIATDVGGTKELIDESNGIIIGKQNSGEVANALEKLYKDRQLLNSMKSAGRRKAEKMSWTKVAEAYLKVYNRVGS